MKTLNIFNFIPSLVDKFTFYWIGAAIGAESSLIGSRKASEAANAAASSSAFRPYNICTGLGTAIFDTKGKGPGGIKGELSDPYANIVGGIQDRLGAGSFQGVDPQISELAGSALGAAGGAFGQLGSFNPQQAAQQRFDSLEALMANSRQRDAQGLESRLLAQGRLGSTGGALSEQSLQDAVEQSRLRNAMAAFDESRAQQGFLGQQAGMFSSLGSQLDAAPFARNQAMLQTALGLEQLPLDMARLGGQIGQAASGAGANSANYLAQAGDITGRTIAGLGQGMAGAFNSYGGGSSGMSDYGAYTDSGYGPVISRENFIG